MENNENNKQSESIGLSLGTTVFIALLASATFIGFIVWISLKINGAA